MEVMQVEDVVQVETMLFATETADASLHAHDGIQKK
jgi:hypothetical protein